MFNLILTQIIENFFSKCLNGIVTGLIFAEKIFTSLQTQCQDIDVITLILHTYLA